MPENEARTPTSNPDATETSGDTLLWRRNEFSGTSHWCVRMKLPDGSVVILPLDPNIPRDNEPAAQSCAAEIRRAFDRGHAEGI
ncbi:MAG: hypothetical protein ACLQVI_40625 [Polyangiaceae bacterium]